MSPTLPWKLEKKSRNISVYYKFFVFHGLFSVISLINLKNPLLVAHILIVPGKKNSYRVASTQFKKNNFLICWPESKIQMLLFIFSYFGEFFLFLNTININNPYLQPGAQRRIFSKLLFYNFFYRNRDFKRLFFSFFVLQRLVFQLWLAQ